MDVGASPASPTRLRADWSLWRNSFSLHGGSHREFHVSVADNSSSSVSSPNSSTSLQKTENVLSWPRSPLIAGGEAGAYFLKIKNSARGSALGEAFVSLADDTSCLQWNPAGLALIEYPAIEFNHRQ